MNTKKAQTEKSHYEEYNLNTVCMTKYVKLIFVFGKQGLWVS